jgi:predicted O-methyltransferase YrrM
MKSMLYGLAKRVWPSGVRWHNMRREACEIRQLLEARARPEALFDFLVKTAYFRTSQVRTEILQLLQLLQEQPPKTICEIGSYRGGTLALLSSAAHEAATMVSVDIHYPWNRRAVHSMLRRAGQRTVCLQADSHEPATVKAVMRQLHGQEIDFLFIDGDHSYAGVKSDFELFRPSVRRGGVIAFHDIVLDSRSRSSTKTASEVGEVPRFWSELKKSQVNTRDLVHDSQQDGYGIGVLQME